MCRGADHLPSRPLHPNSHLKHVNMYTIHVHVIKMLSRHYYRHIQVFFDVCVKCIEFCLSYSGTASNNRVILNYCFNKRLHIYRSPSSLNSTHNIQEVRMLCAGFVTSSGQVGDCSSPCTNVTEWTLKLQQCDFTETRHSFDYTLKKHQGPTLEFKSVQNLQHYYKYSAIIHSIVTIFFFFFFTFALWADAVHSKPSYTGGTSKVEPGHNSVNEKTNSKSAVSLSNICRQRHTCNAF